MEVFLKEAKAVSKTIATLSGSVKRKVLLAMAQGLRDNIQYILKENKKDIEAGKKNKLSSALMDRLLLNEDRVKNMADAIEQIATLK